MKETQLDPRHRSKIDSLANIGECEGYRIGAQLRGGLGEFEKLYLEKREAEIMARLKKQRGRIK